MFSVKQNSINIHEAWSSREVIPSVKVTQSYSFVSGREYELIIRKDRHDNYLSIRDCLTGEVSSEIRTTQTAVIGDLNNEFAGGRQQGQICLIHLSGNTPKVKSLRCISEVISPLIIVYGDSISEGDRVYNDETYTDLLKGYFGTQRVVNSAISGTQINNVINRMQNELSTLKPKYVMVSIGTNGGNSQELFTQCKNIIEEAGAVPIINVPPMGYSDLNTVRGYIENLNCLSVRFDIATAIDNNVDSGKDTTLFEDGIHPNAAGHLVMYKRIFIDAPELLNY